MANMPADPPSPIEAPLPHARVLSYIAVVSTPTRVRDLAAGSLRLIGYLGTVTALFLLALALLNGPRLFMLFRRTPWRDYPRMIVLYAHYDFHMDLLLLFLLLFSCSVMLLLCAKSVHRGRVAACIVALTLVVPVALLVALAAAAFGALGIFNALGIGSRGGQLTLDPRYLLWLLATAALAPVVGAMVDVCNFLLWIARQPGREKPPASFLSR